MFFFLQYVHFDSARGNEKYLLTDITSVTKVLSGYVVEKDFWTWPSAMIGLLFNLEIKKGLSMTLLGCHGHVYTFMWLTLYVFLILITHNTVIQIISLLFFKRL